MVVSLSFLLSGFLHPGWCKISEPSTVVRWKTTIFFEAAFFHESNPEQVLWLFSDVHQFTWNFGEHEPNVFETTTN